MSVHHIKVKTQLTYFTDITDTHSISFHKLRTIIILLHSIWTILHTELHIFSILSRLVGRRCFVRSKNLQIFEVELNDYVFVVTQKLLFNALCHAPYNGDDELKMFYADFLMRTLTTGLTFFFFNFLLLSNINSYGCFYIHFYHTKQKTMFFSPSTELMCFGVVCAIPWAFWEFSNP